MLLKYLLLFLAWSAYFALHSFLAHQKTKDKMKQWLGEYFRFYRLGFNVISIALLLLILLFQFSLPNTPFIQEGLWLSISGIIIFTIGLLILLYSFYTFNLAEFFGFQQMKNADSSKQKEEKQLIKSGLYAYVRHPLYFGVILLLLGALLYLPYYSTLIFVAVVFIYLPIGVHLEEQKLIDEFGREYQQYQREVKMLIPFIY